MRKILQVDFKGGYAELSASAKSDSTFKRCLQELGASEMLLKEFKDELAEFLTSEKPHGSTASAEVFRTRSGFHHCELD